MGRIYIKGIKVEAVIGVAAWERRIKQPLLIDIEIESDLQHAAETDAIEHTIDYVAITRDITELTAHNEFKLLETLAYFLANHLQRQYSIPHLKLAVEKPGAIAGINKVGVEVTLTSKSKHDNFR